MYDEVLRFWFEEIDPKHWWGGDETLDRSIAGRFSALHAQAARCELYEWRAAARGRLAEIIVLDQFSRNIFRGTPAAFAQDSLALALTQEAVTAGSHSQLAAQERAFLCMPFMHSESRKIHERAVELFRDIGIESNLDYEMKHKVIIDRFGRYPHRNAILGRQSTTEELEFLTQPGSSF